jgi:hypothetical protein
MVVFGTSIKTDFARCGRIPRQTSSIGGQSCSEIDSAIDATSDS